MCLLRVLEGWGGGVYRRGEVEGGEIGRRLKGSAKLMPVKNSKLC